MNTLQQSIVLQSSTSEDLSIAVLKLVLVMQFRALYVSFKGISLIELNATIFVVIGVNIYLILMVPLEAQIVSA